VLSRDEDFLQPARPFEWAGLYALAAGTHLLRLGTVSHAHEHAHENEHVHDSGHAHDNGNGHAHGQALERVDLLLLPVGAETSGAIDGQLATAMQLFAAPAITLEPQALLPSRALARLEVKGGAHYRVDGGPTGHCVLFCEHTPEEFGLWLPGAELIDERRYGSHHHDPEIASIGLEDSRPLNPDKLNDWLSYLLQSRGQDILRMKGVLNIEGEDRRYVFHGVHMVYDGQLERPWPTDVARRSRLVFIGRHLDRDELEAGLESCIA
jgi:hypothetical protein